MKNLIITETHRLLSAEMKKVLDAKNISFTFLPSFSRSLDNKTETTNDHFVLVSNPKAMTLDDISRFDLHRLYEKEHNRNIVSLLCDLTPEGGTVFLAQDNDAGGNFMASMLYYHLQDKGIKKENIKRIVGIQEVYRNEKPYLDVYMGNFISEDVFYAILNRKRMEKRFIFFAKAVHKSLMAGYRKITALYLSVINIGEEIEINKKTDGIALATYLVNGMHKRGGS